MKKIFLYPVLFLLILNILPAFGNYGEPYSEHFSSAVVCEDNFCAPEGYIFSNLNTDENTEEATFEPSPSPTPNPTASPYTMPPPAYSGSSVNFSVFGIILLVAVALSIAALIALITVIIVLVVRKNRSSD